MNSVTNKRYLPIGVFDSGVGGLTVLAELQRLFPNEHFVYLGDTANNPYGNRSSEDIIALTRELVRYLDAKPVKLMVIACNTITVTPGLLDAIREDTNVPIVPMSRGADLALSLSKHKKVGVMATVATINSHSHKKMLESKDDMVTVVEAPCPELAGLIEQGHVDDELAAAAVKTYVEPLQEGEVDTIILGCTHFPIIKSLIAEFMDESVELIDPASEMGAEVARILQEQDLANDSGEPGELDVYFTAAAERGQTMAEKLLAGRDFRIHETKGE